MAIKCKKICDQMNMYIDGNLAKNEQDLFLEHIAACEDCRDEFNSLKFMLSLAKEIDVKTPPATLKTSVMAKITEMEHEKSKKPQKSFFINRPVFTALSTAAACLVVIVIAYVFIGGGFLGNQPGNDDMAGLQADAAVKHQDRGEDKTDETLPGIMEAAPEDVNLLELSDYIYDIRITANDQKTAQGEVSALIKTIAGDEYDESTLTFFDVTQTDTELIINIGKENSDALIDALREVFDDITVIGQETENGPIRITISNP